MWASLSLSLFSRQWWKPSGSTRQRRNRATPPPLCVPLISFLQMKMKKKWGWLWFTAQQTKRCVTTACSPTLAADVASSLLKCFVVYRRSLDHTHLPSLRTYPHPWCLAHCKHVATARAVPGMKWHMQWLHWMDTCQCCNGPEQWRLFIFETKIATVRNIICCVTLKHKCTIYSQVGRMNCQGYVTVKNSSPECESISNFPSSIAVLSEYA